MPAGRDRPAHDRWSIWSLPNSFVVLLPPTSQENTGQTFSSGFVSGVCCLWPVLSLPTSICDEPDASGVLPNLRCRNDNPRADASGTTFLTARGVRSFRDPFSAQVPTNLTRVGAVFTAWNSGMMRTPGRPTGNGSPYPENPTIYIEPFPIPHSSSGASAGAVPAGRTGGLKRRLHNVYSDGMRNVVQNQSVQSLIIIVPAGS